jgi:hypothetical protein
MKKGAPAGAPRFQHLIVELQRYQVPPTHPPLPAGVHVRLIAPEVELRVIANTFVLADFERTQ